MQVVLLAKDRHAGEPVLRRFLAVGAVRGHDVQWHDKPSFLAADLARVDLVVCLKSHVDDREVWHKIEAQGVRAVNRREAGRRQAVAMEPGLAEAARTVGRRTGLEIYGLDFVGRPGDRVLIDVNPFPSFRCLPQAADVLWDYLEKIGPGAGGESKENNP